MHGAQSNIVFLCVYDILPHNAFLAELGLGVHHSGVEVYGKEYAFGRCAFGTGVFDCPPGQCPKHRFRERILLGRTDHSSSDVDAIVIQLAQSPSWAGTAYHLLRRNCNTFAEHLAGALLPPSRRLIDDEEFGFATYQGNGMEMEERTGRIVRRLMPWWVNALARAAVFALPEKWIAVVEQMDREAQGMPPAAVLEVDPT